MTKVGLTGNIGSGKSLVASMFEDLGIPVFRADEVSRESYHNPLVQKHVVEIFGTDLLDSSGRLDLKRLAEKVFSDETALKRLTDLLHPYVLARFESWCMEQRTKVVVMESAILYEYGLDGLFDEVIVVTAPLSVRIQRVVERDHVSPEQVMARVKAQWPEDWKTELADIIIVNDGIKPLAPQVERIAHELLKQ